MASEFIARVSEVDPALAEALAARIEQLRSMDRALVESAQAELAELRRRRPRLNPRLRDGYPVDELFDVRALPDPEHVERLLQDGRLAWLIVDRLGGRHHG